MLKACEGLTWERRFPIVAWMLAAESSRFSNAGLETGAAHSDWREVIEPVEPFERIAEIVVRRRQLRTQSDRVLRRRRSFVEPPELHQ